MVMSDDGRSWLFPVRGVDDLGNDMEIAQLLDQLEATLRLLTGGGAESPQPVKIKAILVGRQLDCMPILADKDKYPSVLVAHRLVANDQRVWEVEDIANVNSPDFDRRFGSDSECQIVVYVEKDHPSEASGAEPPQASLPRVDPEASEMTRQKVDYDLKDLIKKLSDPTLARARQEALILGLHEKFWYAPPSRLCIMLERAGLPKFALELVPLVVPRKCRRCMQFVHAKHRPKTKSRLATSFNQVVQADLFFLWGRVFIILVDECTRYKFAEELDDKSFEAISECLMKGWFRYFGPPKIFMCDQEGALSSDAFAHVREQF